MEYIAPIISAIAAIIASIATAVAADSKSAGIQFAELTHDFGTVQEKNGPVSHTFKFTNTGNAPLMIVNASASCGCTRPTYPKKPVASGKTDKIKVTYVPTGRPGEFVKTVTVKTNAKKQKSVKLKIKGVVIPKKDK